MAVLFGVEAVVAQGLLARLRPWMHLGQPAVKAGRPAHLALMRGFEARRS